MISLNIWNLKKKKKNLTCRENRLVDVRGRQGLGVDKMGEGGQMDKLPAIK